jgi:3-oxoacyl-[acyl-carrier-protein] synthase II
MVKMQLYIRSTASISPQKTFSGNFFSEEPLNHVGSRMNSLEPDYSAIIDPKLMRRMSRIIKMGVAAAMECLTQASIKVPDAIITGTAYGCLEDTEIFLTRMVENKEELLTPTAFIQSTHNTVGAQIALILQCHRYNNTFVHRGFSFENALLDGMMLINEKEAVHVLVGGIDEITKVSHAILNRFGIYKTNAPSSLGLFKTGTKGTLAGEGAAFFLLSSEASEKNLARLNGMKTFYKPGGPSETENAIRNFLTEQEVNPEDIHLLITGNNGDPGNDKVYGELGKSLFSNIPTVHFKHLCGEYPTASSFALWLAANLINRSSIPEWLECRGGTLQPKITRILIYNHYQHIHHSLFLISAC